MLAIPPAVLDELKLAADAPVSLAVRSGRLVVELRPRPRYSLDQLLSETRASTRRPKDRAWAAGAARGRELI